MSQLTATLNRALLFELHEYYILNGNIVWKKPSSENTQINSVADTNTLTGVKMRFKLLIF